MDARGSHRHPLLGRRGHGHGPERREGARLPRAHRLFARGCGSERGRRPATQPRPDATAERACARKSATSPPIEGLRGVAVLWVMLFHYCVLRDGRFDDAFIAVVKSWRAAGGVRAQRLPRRGPLLPDHRVPAHAAVVPACGRGAAGAGLARASTPGARGASCRRTTCSSCSSSSSCCPSSTRASGSNPRPSSWATSGRTSSCCTTRRRSRPRSMTVNGALWTLAIEFQYYLLLPLVAPLFVRWPWRSLLRGGCDRGRVAVARVERSRFPGGRVHEARRQGGRDREGDPAPHRDAASGVVAALRAGDPGGAGVDDAAAGSAVGHCRRGFRS